MNPLLDLDAHPIIAHRGASGAAPENTLEAFDLAAREGCDAFELDVHVTVDDVPVVIHDPTLQRTTDRAGRVAAQTLVGVRGADAGCRFTADGGRTFPWRGRGVRVPVLAEVLEAFPAMPMLIEVKEPRAQAAVRRALVAAGAASRCVVASDRHEALTDFRDGPFVCGASRDDITRLYVGRLFGRREVVGYRFLSVPEYHRGLRVVTRRFVAAARALGCPVHVWTVNDPLRAKRLWEKGVCGIVTNYPERMREARR